MSHLLLSQLLALLVPASLHRPAPLSDFVGVYALVDKVVVEGDSANPKAIQVWGVFSHTDGSRFNYTPAERGYMYFAFDRASDHVIRAEWADLKSAAGSRQVVAFGDRTLPAGRVRRSTEPAASPDAYPLGYGVVKIPKARSYPPDHALSSEHELLAVPAPRTPAEAAKVSTGAVRLVARNAVLANVQYMFQINGPNGETETSPAIAAGASETAWTPKLQVRTGAAYTWKVWTVEGAWNSQAASSSFTGN